MNNKNNTRFVLLITVLMLVFNFTVVFGNAETWENEYGKLEVNPTVCYNPLGEFKQYYNITWYYPDNTLDFAFRFNHSLPYGQIYYFNGNDYQEVTTNHITYNDYHYYQVSNVDFEQNETKHGYWEYKTLYPYGKWDLFVKRSSDSWSDAFTSGLYIHLDPWFDSDWDYKKKITIDHDQVEGDLTNFPVYMKIVDTDLKDNAQADGDDICFTNDDEDTKLNHEIEDYDSSTGTLYVIVNVTSISSSVDTDFYMYYGHATATNQQSITDTWDSDFLAVYHLSDTDWLDSTSNDYDLTNDGVTVSDCKFYKCADFDGSSELTHANLLDSGYDGITLEYYFNCDDASDLEDIHIYKQNTGGATGTYLIPRHTNNDITGTFKLTGEDETSSTSDDRLSDATWYYHAILLRDSDSKAKAFLSGDFYHDGSCSNSWSAGTQTDFLIGSKSSSPFEGNIDEIRVSKIGRSDNWIHTTYNNLNNNTNNGFFSLDTEVPQTPTCECLISNMVPVNNTLNINPVTGNLSVDVNASLGCTIEYINISVFDNLGNLINYTNYTSQTNGTFIHELENDSLAYSTTYYWNVSTLCNVTQNTSDTLQFTTKAESGASIDYDLLEKAIEDALRDYGSFRESDTITLDATQFLIIIELILFTLFTWIGYKIPAMDGNEGKAWHYVPFIGGLFFIFSGMTFLGFGLTISSYTIPIVQGMFMSIGIIILIYGVLKAFYYGD